MNAQRLDFQTTKTAARSSGFPAGDQPALGKRANLRPSNNNSNIRYDTRRLQSAAIKARMLSEHRSRLCGCVPVPKRGAVQIHIDTASGTCRYVSLYHCASATACPVCAATVRARRAQEIIYAGKRMIQEGFTYVSATLTAAHGPCTKLHEFIKQFNDAARKMKSGRAWQAFAGRWAVRYSIRTVDTTDDAPGTDPAARSGWHYHFHIIFFLEKHHLTENEAQKMESELADMWINALGRVGLSASRANGVAVDLPHLSVGVSGADAIKPLAQYVAKNVAWEMTGQDTKIGRMDRRISIWGMQRLALTSHPELLPRLDEYIRAMRGIAWMTWTQGLKHFVGLDELSDAELLEGAVATPIYTLTQADLTAVARQAGQRKLLEAAEAGGLEGIRAALAAAHAGHDILIGEPWLPPA